MRTFIVCACCNCFDNIQLMGAFPFSLQHAVIASLRCRCRLLQFKRKHRVLAATIFETINRWEPFARYMRSIARENLALRLHYAKLMPGWQHAIFMPKSWKNVYGSQGLVALLQKICQLFYF